MDLFHRLDDAQCIVRVKGGTYKQAELYRRGRTLYAKSSGGFVRVCPKWGDAWGTSNPSVTIIDMPEAIRREYHL